MPNLIDRPVTRRDMYVMLEIIAKGMAEDEFLGQPVHKVVAILLHRAANDMKHMDVEIISE